MEFSNESKCHARHHPQLAMQQEPTLEQLKYPIGHANIPEKISAEDIENWINILEKFPKKFSALTSELTEEQLETPYRPDGWTLRQTIHHVADSHHHSYIRFKWALTEDNPLIKAYFEARWANLHDTREAPIHLSLNALASTHAKLVYLLRGLSFEELQQSFIHPETNQEVTLAKNIGVYAWHGAHHYAHIEHLLKRKGWV